MSYMTRLAADRNRREHQRRRRRLLITLATAACAVAALPLFVVIAAGVPALDHALPNVYSGRYGQGGTVADDPQSDLAGSRRACQAPLWRRALSKPATRAVVTVVAGTRPLYRVTIDCSNFEIAVDDAPPT